MGSLGNAPDLWYDEEQQPEILNSKVGRMDLCSAPLELIPLEGLRLGNTLLPLSASKEQVETLLGPAEVVHGSRWYYVKSDLSVSFDPSGQVEFIEFLGGLEGRLQPTIYGLPAFQTGADELIEELTRRNDGPVDDHEQDYSYAFLNISVGVYRSILPKDVQEMIAEMEADGIPTRNNPDLERDKRRAEHWETIGIGVAGYYQ